MSVRLSIRTTGCKVNQADAEAVARALADLAVTLVGPDEPADVAVVNACTVTAAADRDGRAAVHRAVRSGASVVLTGCLAARGVEVPEGVRVVAATSDRSALVAALREEIGRRGPGTGLEDGLGLGLGFGDGNTGGRPSRARPLVKVQDGCDCRCTYCIVPLVRGGSRSVPVEAAEAAVRDAAEAGAAEVVLTGVDLGAWGKDAGDDLAGLLARLVGLRTGLRFRLSSVEPHGLTDRLVGLMADSPDVCPHLHVPLQSGSDRVLAAMGRPYDSATFAGAVGRAAGRVPGLALGMDVICGFPGEDEADFEATRSLVAALPFTYLHVFPFSPRPGTPAAAMPGAASRTERDRRCRVLRGMSSAARTAHAASLVGRNVEVVDVRGRSEGVESLAADYTRVMRPGVQEPRPGRFEVKVAAADGAAAVSG